MFVISEVNLCRNRCVFKGFFWLLQRTVVTVCHHVEVMLNERVTNVRMLANLRSFSLISGCTEDLSASHDSIRQLYTSLFFPVASAHSSVRRLRVCLNSFGSKRLLVSQHVWFVMKHTASQRRLATKEEGNRWSRYVQSS